MSTRETLMQVFVTTVPAVGELQRNYPGLMILKVIRMPQSDINIDVTEFDFLES